MNFRRILPLAVLVAATAAHADLNFASFATTAGLTLNGSAVQSGTALRLTDAVHWQSGTAWSQATQAVEGGFDTTFDYSIFGGNGADGLTFALQDRGATEVGGGGGSLAFNGISSVYGVQFRTYDHNKIQIGSFTDTPVASVDDAGLRGSHKVRITYVPGTMRVYLDDALAVTGAVDLTGMYSQGAYVGFTSATGGSNDVHQITNWSFKSGAPQAVPEPGTVAALSLGALGLLRRRRKA